MNPVGIMQGRLSPAPSGRPQAFPWNTWPAEFARAAACGFGCLEWLVTADRYGENPLGSDQGVEHIKALMVATGVRVTSLCADYLIAQPLVRLTEADRSASIDRLERLIERGAMIGVKTIVIPILEHGAIKSADDEAEMVAVLTRLSPHAARHGLRIGVEADLPAPATRALMAKVSSPVLGVCYDVGNAVAAGLDPVEELRLLGPVLYGVHIKDRRRGGPSVPLGTGAVDFARVFETLDQIEYGGSLILETPVGDDAMVSAQRHRAFLRQMMTTGHAIGR